MSAFKDLAKISRQCFAGSTPWREVTPHIVENSSYEDMEYQEEASKEKVIKMYLTILT